ncbi:DUF4097 family beta strand repeat-containing protein [Streptomyces sp. UH6]|uniref:DUF4097 family beta strand repeat-containing protein n=1 Tax=Streptomyces sp. UH6 TaxID=2748379 RepID=UPI0015D4DA5C|nr:DUF4097 family beta strand repeat-containing protein [Streptomyces sp. UH6]NYV78438.1 DUF4097 family beta strand repeat protein [Streptomyces sp. UH6]
MRKFDTPATISAVLDIPAGRVRLVASDRTDTTVEVLPADAAKGRDVKAAERTGVAFEGGTLRIEAGEPHNRLVGHPGSVEVTVHLPAGSHVGIKASDVDLRGVGRLGDVSVEADQGTVTLDESDGTRVAVLAGDVTVARLAGPAEISTRKGDIDITEARRGTVTVRTEMGDIKVGAASGVSATLDAGTGSGRIDNALRNADGSAAGLNIHATTGYGDISARSL